MIPKSISKETVLGMIVLSLVVGSLILAIIDSSTRATFADLTKVAVGTYIGLHIPSPNQRT
ncbi:hypothetical protein FACHB389_31650 [Nostoc calcicola FACHB-389]|nr:hypothetical protein [Nostoc calcicola FACHB-3891]OKH21482.1 hypothetical protein FACHB389_31650 [Nostoc calcicola FACHB-389]